MHAPINLPSATVLAVDVGGTNTSCAIVDSTGGAFIRRFERRYSTKAEPSLLAPLGRFMDEATTSGAPSPSSICVSGAGPVVGRSITLTNAPWGIDGDELESRFGLPTAVINDFSAIAWGVLLLDPDNPDELVQLMPPGGSRTALSDSGPVVVIGAGTGLGFGYALRDESGTKVYPSEGGHVCLPVYDADSRAFSVWLEGKYGFAILDLPEDDRPARISCAADSGDPLCARAMDMFVRLYARVACDAAAVFLPTGGVYLAGGVAAKNLSRFTEGDRFMRTFGMAYREHVRDIAARTPVFVVKDYAISIYGAANAALHMARREG
jgi:glucokinase